MRAAYEAVQAEQHPTDLWTCTRTSAGAGGHGDFAEAIAAIVDESDEEVNQRLAVSRSADLGRCHELPRRSTAPLLRRVFSDPSTLNNSVANHNNAAPLPPGVQGWSPNGRHHFQLRGCVVRSAVDASGTALSAPAQDTLIQGSVASTDGTGVARLVDLDPQHQIGSQIWGLEYRVQDSASQGFTAVMETASLRQLGRPRPRQLLHGAGGTYQSVLTPVKWTPTSCRCSRRCSRRSARRARTGSRSGSSAALRLQFRAHVRLRAIVGTVGPSAASEPARFIADRRLVHAGADFGVASINSAAYNTAPFKVDASRRRLVIDLGNALPEEASGDRRAIGPLRAES